MDTPLIQINNVSFAYETEPVVSNINLTFQPGEFAGVIGPNGSGKSTLLKLMGGLLPSKSGEILIKGTDVLGYKRKALARSLAWVPQEHTMPFSFKVAEIVLMGRHAYLSPFTFETEEDRQIAQRSMEMTETIRYINRSFNEISGGEKQRVMIASAIAQEPEIMLLDEPTSALDIKYQLGILNILKKLNQDNGMTLITAMHDLHLASKFCARLILLKEGKIVIEGPPNEVLRKEILEEVYGVKVKLFHDPDDGSVLISPETSCAF